MIAALGSRRTAGLLGAGMVLGAVLTGCSGGGMQTAPAAATRPAEASAAPAADTAGTDLAAGLLPATAFGNGAGVTPLPTDRLAQAGMLAGALPGLHLMPDCAAAVQAVLPRVAGVEDAAAQLAHVADTATVEVLARPGAGADAVGALTDVVAACPSTTVEVPGHGTVSVTLASLDPAAIPARGVGVVVTVEATGPEGPWHGTGLAALVPDGDRVLALAQASRNGSPPDTASFTDLLRRAYRVQADALD